MVLQMRGLWVRNNTETQLAFEVNVLEILKRAKSGGEVVAWNEKEENVKDEVLRRNAKAGYCNSDGSPVNPKRIVSKPANDRDRKNYKRIFRPD